MRCDAVRCDPATRHVRHAAQELKWDLNAWRSEEQSKLRSAKPVVADSLAAGFEALDMDGGAGWDLLTRLMAYTPADRCASGLA